MPAPSKHSETGSKHRGTGDDRSGLIGPATTERPEHALERGIDQAGELIVEPYWAADDHPPLRLPWVVADGELRVHINDQPVPVALDAPVRLSPVAIPKPWGHERWYTGIEARGVSTVELPLANGRVSLPLPLYLALAPDRLCAGRTRDLVLLKILDAHPDPELGDLYFEVHDVKEEVYVVTHVDQRAWPNEVGAIRLGMDQARRRKLGEPAFRDAYLATTNRWRACRDRVDAAVDSARAAAGIALDATLTPHETQALLADVDRALRNEETEARIASHGFSTLHPLRVGDVVRVPTGTPHALQHGMRVIEFQTPSYERKILSFAQKVMTQDGWDTAEAAATMSFDAPSPTELEVTADTADYRLERVALFADFEVLRLRIAAAGRAHLDRRDYALCIGLRGTVRVGPLTLAPEDAAFIPSAATDGPFANHTDEDALVLIARPLPTVERDAKAPSPEAPHEQSP